MKLVPGGRAARSAAPPIRRPGARPLRPADLLPGYGPGRERELHLVLPGRARSLCGLEPAGGFRIQIDPPTCERCKAKLSLIDRHLRRTPHH